MALFSQTKCNQDEISVMLSFAEILFEELKYSKFDIRAIDKECNPTHWVVNENIINDEQKSRYPNYEQLKENVFSIAHNYTFNKFNKFNKFKNINTNLLNKNKMYCALNYLKMQPGYEYEGMNWHTDDLPFGDEQDNADVIIFYLQKDENIKGADLQIKNPEIEDVPVIVGDVAYIHGSLPHCVTKATASGLGKRIALMFIYPRNIYTE